MQVYLYAIDKQHHINNGHELSAMRFGQALHMFTHLSSCRGQSPQYSQDIYIIDIELRWQIAIPLSSFVTDTLVDTVFLLSELHIAYLFKHL